MHTVLKWIDYNRYTVIGALLAAVIALGVVGCDPKVTSPISGNQVTTHELTAEVTSEKINLEAQWATIETKLKQLETKTGPAYAELERKQLAITQALVFVDQLITQYAGPAGAPIATAIGLAGLFFGGGVKADNRRKDAIIAENKATPVK